MKKKLPMIIAVIAAIALAAVYFLMNRTPSARSGGYLFVPAKNESFESIRISNSNGSMSFYKKDGEWKVSDGENEYFTNSDKMKLLTGAISSFPIKRIINGKSPEYGLDKPSAIVEFNTSTGRTGKIYIGNTCVNASECYAAADGVDGTIITDSAAAIQFNGNLSSYRTNDVFVVDLAALTEIDFTEDGERKITLSKDGKNWRISYPCDSGARAIDMNELVTSFLKWSIAGYLDESETPGSFSSEMKLSDRNGVTQTIKLGEPVGNYISASIDGKEDIVSLYSTDVDLSPLNVETLIYEVPLLIPINDSQRTVLTYGDEKYDFEYDYEMKVAKLNGKLIDVSSLEGIYSRFVLCLADGFDPVTRRGKLVASIENTLKDGSTVKVDLYERDDDTLFMDFDGKTQFYMNKSRLDNALERIAKVA